MHLRLRQKLLVLVWSHKSCSLGCIFQYLTDPQTSSSPSETLVAVALDVAVLLLVIAAPVLSLSAIELKTSCKSTRQTAHTSLWKQYGRAVLVVKQCRTVVLHVQWIKSELAKLSLPLMLLFPGWLSLGVLNIVHKTRSFVHVLVQYHHCIRKKYYNENNLSWKGPIIESNS